MLLLEGPGGNRSFRLGGLGNRIEGIVKQLGIETVTIC